MDDGSIKAKTGFSAGTLAAVAVIVVWAAASLQAFRAEVFTWSIMPELLMMDSREKSALTSGPVFRLSQNASMVIPEDSAVYFLKPPGEGDNGYLTLKLKYYLYPRRVVDVDSVDFAAVSGMKNNDHIIVLAPGYGYPGPLEGSAYAEKVFESGDENGLEMIYRVVKGE